MLTWVSVSRKAINQNITTIKRYLGPKVALMPVVKSNAYGHGIFPFAELCDKHTDVHALCVVSLDEALALKKIGIKKPILILAIYDLSDTQSLREAIKRGVRFAVYTLEQIKRLNAVAKAIKTSALVHFKIDTGTSRVGILAKEAVLFVQKMCSSYPHLIVEGIFSHFASSESDTMYTRQQFNEFQTVLKEIEKQGIPVPAWQHFACSAASLNFAYTRLNSARIGINVYGLHSVPKGDKWLSITPALSWYTTVIQVKTLPKNTSVSYGRTFTTKRPTKLAVLPVGYYDGYDRRLSNNSCVIIQGVKCPVRGRICMNLTMVDVTNVPSVRAGDIATLIGSQRNVSVSADELAQCCQTINYEITTKINPSIPRLYV